jgi:hypothetical protein
MDQGSEDLNNSFEYSAGKNLGKNGNNNAVYWKKHPDCDAGSDNGFKTTKAR